MYKQIKYVKIINIIIYIFLNEWILKSNITKTKWVYELHNSTSKLK